MLKGVPTIVTNAHVMSGNPNVKFLGLNSRELPAGKLSFSQNYDLAALTQTEMTDGIPVMEDVDKNAKIGDEVVVLGNSQGSSVVTEITGKITGIGPDLIEVDAKFVEGNSGSPIIHIKSGKAIGVATFVTLRKLSAIGTDSQFTDIRRFGYRLDTAIQWEPTTLKQVAAEAEVVETLKKTTDALHALLLDIYQNGSVSMGIHEHAGNPLRSAATEYLQVIANAKHSSPSDIASAKKRFLRSALSVCSGDLKSLNPATYLGYHRKKIEHEREVRKVMEEKLNKLLESQDAAGRLGAR